MLKPRTVCSEFPLIIQELMIPFHTDAHRPNSDEIDSGRQEDAFHQPMPDFSEFLGSYDPYSQAQALPSEILDSVTWSAAMFDTSMDS